MVGKPVKRLGRWTATVLSRAGRHVALNAFGGMHAVVDVIEKILLLCFILIQPVQTEVDTKF